jgi:hypothetical protein
VAYLGLNKCIARKWPVKGGAQARAVISGQK